MAAYAFTDQTSSAPAVRKLLEHADPAARGASLNVHPNDDMFAFSVAVTAGEPIGAMAYFRAGVSIVDVIDAVARWRFGGLQNVSSFLDFAAGYGRSTRFLVEHLPADRVTVAEIQEPALEFQAREFGVDTLLSTSDPADLQVQRTYDYVFVASLLTHLPDRTFAPWLAKVWEFVAPGGVLVFSVHDADINDLGVELQEGFVFLPTTEVASLSTDEYGTNFTTEAYVRRRLAEGVGREASGAARLPRALCFMQDVWVVPKGGPATEPLTYECGPNGALDVLEIEGRQLTLRGWAADRGWSALGASSHAISSVAVHINRRKTALGRLGIDRPEVAAHLGRPDDPLLRASGWQVTTRAHVEPTDIVTAVATCEHGARFVMDSTTVGDLLARTGVSLRPSPMRRRMARAGRGVRLALRDPRAAVARIRQLRRA